MHIFFFCSILFCQYDSNICSSCFAYISFTFPLHILKFVSKGPVSISMAHMCAWNVHKIKTSWKGVSVAPETWWHQGAFSFCKRALLRSSCYENVLQTTFFCLFRKPIQTHSEKLPEGVWTSFWEAPKCFLRASQKAVQTPSETPLENKHINR